VFDDTYLNMELAVTRDGPEFAKAKGRLRDKDGQQSNPGHEDVQS
jgi:hypothetical protein